MYQQTGRPEFAPRLWVRLAVTVNQESSEATAQSTAQSAAQSAAQSTAESSAQSETRSFMPHDFGYFVSAGIDGRVHLSLAQRVMTRMIVQLSEFHWPDTHWSFGDERENAGMALPLVGLARQPYKPGTDIKAAAYRQLEHRFEYVIEGKNGYLNLEQWRYKQPGMNRNYPLSTFWADHKLRIVV